MEPPGVVLVAIAGPCGAGKTTLAKALLLNGINARAIAQEHSYVPDMWRKITNPDVLIFLDVSYELTVQRRQLNWTKADYDQQMIRLAHARANATLIIDTNYRSPDLILLTVISYLELR